MKNFLILLSELNGPEILEFLSNNKYLIEGVTFFIFLMLFISDRII